MGGWATRMITDDQLASVMERHIDELDAAVARMGAGDAVVIAMGTNGTQVIVRPAADIVAFYRNAAPSILVFEDMVKPPMPGYFWLGLIDTDRAMVTQVKQYRTRKVDIGLA